MEPNEESGVLPPIEVGVAEPEPAVEAPAEAPEPAQPQEPKDIAEATAFIQEHCRVEQWAREQDDNDSLYYRLVSVKLTVDTGEIIYEQKVLDQPIPLNLFYVRAARMLFTVKQRHEQLKAEGA